VKRIHATIIAGILLLMLILPQLALAAGPEIGDVDVENITFTTATITWTTNTTSDSEVNYGTDRPKDGTWKSVHDPAEVTHHSILLQNLTPKETYYFEVESEDAYGTTADNNDGEYYSFKTPAWYSISLNPISGSCGEEITVTVTVATPGTYHVCWDSLTAADEETFTATMAGGHTLTFDVPEATKGIHKVYLADNAYAQKAYADFEIFPSAKINPDEGPVGTAVTLSGCGFTASQDITVTLFQDEVQKGEEKTDTTGAEGTWGPISYTIPDTPAGDYDFVVEVEEARWVSKHFTVTPEITVTPSSGTVGQTIEVSGTGFAGGEEDVEVTFDGEVVEPNTPIVVGQDGSWEATIVIPPLHRGTHTIDALGEWTRARDVPDVKFVVGAGILVGPPGSYYVGDTITVKGGGFATGETGIRVYFEGAPVTPTFTAKGDGTWETSFVLSASSYGSHTVLASGTITTTVTTTLSTKAKIESISPVEGAPGDSVTLTGSGFSNNKGLTVSVGGVAASENTQTQANGNVVINFRVPASPEGKQTVTATDQGGATASRSDYFTVTKKVLPTPLPTSPKDHSKLRSGQVTFQWLTSGSNVTYTLEISETADFTSIFQPQSGIEESRYTLTEEEALPKGTYYWRIKVVDDYDNESTWSDSRKFTVSPIPIWVWVVVGVVVLVGLMVVAYRETKFKVTE
jgi:hypothetical protein